MARQRFWLGLVALLLLGLGMARADVLPPIAIGFYMPVVRDVPRKDVEVTLRFWFEEVAQSVKLNYKPVKFYDDLAEMKRDMNTGTINFLVATSMGVVQHFSPDELGNGFTGSRALPENLLLVVRRAAGIHRLGDLAGKRFALLDQEELSDVYLETLLMKTWRTPDVSHLASVVREKRSSALVHRLFFDQSDAALIYRNAYEAALAMNPQIAERVQVLDDYSFRGRMPSIGLFSSRVSQENRDFLVQTFMKFNDTPRGRQVLQIYQADALVPTSVHDLDPYRELLAANRALKSALATPAKKGPR